MNIIICGAGEVGRHAAEVLGANSSDITIIDLDHAKLAELEDLLDVRVLLGNGTHTQILLEAGCAKADLFLAATNIDEINLLSASIAKGVGAKKVIARVHHSAHFDHVGLDYHEHLGIDHLVCPEHTTAVAIAQMLRTPGALVVERFARGQIQVQQFPVSDDAPAIGKPLMALGLPAATRVASIERQGTAFIPDGRTEIHKGDIVTLIGEVKAFEKACKLLVPSAGQRKRIMIMGQTAMGVWLCRALHSRTFSVRLLVEDQPRAEELAAKLPWVTVLRAEPGDATILNDERIDQVDAFVALTGDDEHNILAAARAKSMGAKSAVAVLQRPTYLHLLKHVGIDRAFSPRTTAINQLQQWLQDEPVRHLASLAVGIADVYEVNVPSTAKQIIGKKLKDVVFPAKTMIAAIQRGDQVYVPGADDEIAPADTVVVIGPAGLEKQLRKLFSVHV